MFAALFGSSNQDSKPVDQTIQQEMNFERPPKRLFQENNPT